MRNLLIRGAMAMVVFLGLMPGCDGEPDLGEITPEVTITCGGRVYQQQSKFCAGSANGQPLSPYVCRAGSVPTRDAAGTPLGYYIGPCLNGQLVRRKPSYYDQFVPGTATVTPKMNLYVGPGGGGVDRTRYLYTRALQQPMEALTSLRDPGSSMSLSTVLNEARQMIGDPPKVGLASGPINTSFCGGLTYYYQTSVCSGGQCRTQGTPAETAGGIPYALYDGPCSGGLRSLRPLDRFDVWSPSWTPPLAPSLTWNLSTGTAAHNVFFRAQPQPWDEEDPDPSPGDAAGDDTSDDAADDDGTDGIGGCNIYAQLCDTTSDCQQGDCAGSNFECYLVGAVGFPGGQDNRCCSSRGPSPSYSCLLSPGP